MTITYDEEARPVVWLLEGSVEYKGDTFRFWYQYDERDGEVLHEFRDGEPEGDFDYDDFTAQCQAEVEKKWNVTTDRK